MSKKQEITEKKIADFFATTPQTLYNWKTSKKSGVALRYEVLKKFYIKNEKLKIKLDDTKKRILEYSQIEYAVEHDRTITKLEKLQKKLESKIIFDEVEDIQ